MHNANSICVSVHVGEMDLYIRFWEYSCGVGHYPDWSIIIVRSNFKRNQQENLKDLARFFKEYAPRYGYKYLCTKDEWLQVLLDPWFETYTQRIFQTI